MDDVEEAARAFGELYPALYIALHRRDGKRRSLTSASRGVLMHLAQTGPLTIGECAAHLSRAQSVVSEIVDQLESHGLLARVRDESDRRRTLVWLTDTARERLVEEQEVLSRAAVTRAMRRMRPADRAKLLEGARALLVATRGDDAGAAEVARDERSPERGTRRKRR